MGVKWSSDAARDVDVYSASGPLKAEAKRRLVLGHIRFGVEV